MYYKNLEQLPWVKFWAIISTTSVHIPGDARSISAPGHGYPPSIEYHPKVQYFATEAEWLGRIEAMTKLNRIFRAFIIDPVEVETKISIKERD